MSFDPSRNHAVRTLAKDSYTYSFKGTVLRAGSFVLNEVTQFVFTIKKDSGETEVFNTAPSSSYFQDFLEIGTGDLLLRIILTYASQVKEGDRVDVLALNSDNRRIIHFIEPEPLSEEKAKELDRT